MIDPRTLPVYEQRDRILSALEHHRVVVVESPTGSGKTTQLPIILHEAGYSKQGVIGVTQPRRIAAVSVSSFIARQLNASIPGLVGYKMRFDDHTTDETRIKVMTDGILLQEIKNDQYVRDYSVIMVDEAHERSLNIDFVLGLLKRALELRSDLRVVVSSATINAEIFSVYFDSCPVVRIDTEMFPVQVIYDNPTSGAVAQQLDQVRGRSSQREAREIAYDARIDRVVSIIDRVEEEQYPGDVLIFLPGEQMIKDCMTRLLSLPYRARLHVQPLYGRLSKEEQDEVFPPAPEGTRKIVIATNIAETSITIDGITVVVDSGLAKTNYYNPRTYTSALVEGPISRASADQRRGRAGRTRPGRCYRLYGRSEYEDRPLFQEDEIYRTDLSEVVLRMAELGITDFEEFDFISSPGVGNIRGAVETLRLLDAIDEGRALTRVGEMMAQFPLLPRHSRIIVEAIHRHPDVLDEVIIAVSFLTSQTPYTLPPGEEMEARQAHHRYRDDLGDFVSYLRLFEAFKAAPDRKKFCESRYLDLRTMGEIVNVRDQLAEIVSAMGIPIGSGGSKSDYLTAIARGLIQFVCIHTGRGVYQSLTAERIQIHPGSGLFRETPPFIVAGEIVRTSRTYARSVSPLKREWLADISGDLYDGLKRGREVEEVRDPKTAKRGERDTTWQLQVGREAFTMVPYKGKKKIVILPWDRLGGLYRDGRSPSIDSNAGRIRARIERDGWTLLNGERLSTALRIVGHLDRDGAIVTTDGRKLNWRLPEDREGLLAALPDILALTPARSSSRQLGFLALYSSGNGTYRMKANRGFYNAVHESLASLEQLVDDLGADGARDGDVLGAMYRRLSAIIDED